LPYSFINPDLFMPFLILMRQFELVIFLDFFAKLFIILDSF